MLGEDAIAPVARSCGKTACSFGQGLGRRSMLCRLVLGIHLLGRTRRGRREDAQYEDVGIEK